MEDLRKLVLKKFKRNFQGNWPTATEYEKNELIDFLYEEVEHMIDLKNKQLERVNDYESQIKICLKYPEEEYNKFKFEILDKFSEQIKDGLKDERKNLEDIKNCNSGVYTKYLIFYSIISHNTGMYFDGETEIRKAIQQLNEDKCDETVISNAVAQIAILQELRNFNYPEKLKVQLDTNFEKYEDVCEA